MSDDFAEACMRLEDEVDAAVARALREMTPQEIAKELRRMADQWEDEDA